jgi:hypothetical protein
MTAPTARVRLALVALSAAAVAAALASVAFALPDHSSARKAPLITASPAPAGWPELTLPNGTAVLSYPPSLHPVSGDHDAVSAAMLSPAGTYLLYLNATPRQGAENLRNWAGYRLRVLTSDDASFAHRDAAATGLRFRGGIGSCVIDSYVTRIRAHHFSEIACLVKGRTSESVVVATAPTAQWPRARPLLERAVAAYRVR